MQVIFMKPTDEMELLQNAVTLAQEGHREEARVLLEKIVEADPHFEMAWLWLVETVEKPALRVSILRECLRLNPGSKMAKEGLALLTHEVPQGAVSPEPLFPPPPPMPPDSKGKRPASPPRSRMLPSVSMAVGCFLLVVLIAAGSLIGGLVVLPVMNGRPPAVVLPAPVNGWVNGLRKVTPTVLTQTPTLTPTETFTPTATWTSSNTPTETLTPVLPIVTPTPNEVVTPSPAPPSTPTLFTGANIPNPWEIRYLAAGSCTAMSVPISGGGSKTLTVSPPANCAYAQLSADGTRLAYIDRPGWSRILVMNIDGTNPREIVKLAPFEGLPLSIWGLRWSPFGTRLAFVSPSYGYGDGHKPFVEGESSGWLYVVPTDVSSAPKQVNALRIEQRFVEAMRWSPDGQRILVLDHRDAANGAGYYPYAYRVNDSAFLMMANLDFQPDANPRFDWSFDSRFVSHLLGRKPKEYDCVARNAPDDQAYLIIASLIEQAGLPHEPARQCVPLPQNRAWSTSFGALWPTTNTKSLLLYDSGSNSLVTMAPNGANVLPILTLEQQPLYAGWSPDGMWIYFIESGSPADSGGILEVARSDGTDRRVLAYGVTPGPVVWK
jgi:hypothetical protein